MLISYQWIRELLGSNIDPGSPHVVAERLTQSGLEVEALTHVGAHLAMIRVARVLSQRPHPSGKNTLVTIELAPGESLEVVCGAPNVPPAGGLVCFAPTGATVFDKKGRPITLVEKSIGGVSSKGMLCAEDELGLGTDHDGIVVLDAPGLAPGATLVEAFPALEDWILTVNVTPNRPDALGHLGVAREAAALAGFTFEGAGAATIDRAHLREPGADESLTVRVDDVVGCPEYRAQRLANVRVGPSPLAVRVRLFRLGVRPINTVVDVTNLVLLERGQPLHAFDHARLADQTIVVRRASENESIETLDGQNRALDRADLVIADAAQPIAIAGVMGSEASGVRDETTRVVLEAAFFQPTTVRRSAQRHRIHSEASHRFEREVDRAGVRSALDRAAALLVELAGATIVGAPVSVVEGALPPVELTMRFARCSLMLGYDVPRDEAVAALTRLGFGIVQHDESAVTVRVPGARRADVRREIDLIEEVARVLGYERIPSALPPTAGARAGSTRDFSLRRRVRAACTGAGLDEAVTYGFLSAHDLERTGLGKAPVVRVQNPLSEERALLRPSLLPLLARAAAHSVRHGEKRVRLFEVGTVFAPQTEQNVAGPSYDAQLDDPLCEETHLAVLLVGPRDAYLTRPESVDFFDGKGCVELVVEALLNERARFDRDAEPPPYLHPRACARVLCAGGTALGWVGELHPDVCEAWELPRASVACELRVAPLGATPRTPVAHAPGRFPAMVRDVALELQLEQPAGAVADALRDAAGALCVRVDIVDRFRGGSVAANAHALTYALWFRSDERTLRDEEVEQAMQRAVAAVTERYGAKQR